MKASNSCWGQEDGREGNARDREGESTGRREGASGIEEVRAKSLKFENQSSDMGSIPVSRGTSETLVELMAVSGQNTSSK